jgi:hypothetical protein
MNRDELVAVAITLTLVSLAAYAAAWVTGLLFGAW